MIGTSVCCRCVASRCGVVVAGVEEVTLESTRTVVVAPPSPTSEMSGDHKKVSTATHSSIHSSSPLSVNPLILPSTQLLYIYPLSYYLGIYPLNRISTHIHSIVHPFTHLSIHSSILRPFLPSFLFLSFFLSTMHLFTHPPTHPSIYI